MPEGEGRFAAVLCTDIANFPTSPGEEARARYLLEKQSHLLRPIFSVHRGRELEAPDIESQTAGLKGWLTGPAATARRPLSARCLVVFNTAQEATNCALEIDRAVHEHNRSVPSDKDIHLRMAIHVGEVERREGEALGEGVAVASKILSLGQGGEIYLSEQAYDSVKDKMETEEFERFGPGRTNDSDLREVYRLIPHRERHGPELIPMDRQRIAVLPFVNISPDPRDEYFADGLTEELISTVSTLSQLNVISRTSVMGYKGTSKKVGEIGRELKVGTILEGSVRKAENAVRVTVQLIEVGKDKHLWAQSYDRELKNIFAVQSDIASQVAATLRVKMLPEEKARIEARPTASEEAHILYLKGRHYWNERSKEGLHKSVEYFQRAVQKDPDFALGFAGLADAYYILAHNEYTEPSPAFAKAKDYLTRALSIDSGLAEAHATLASILFDTDHDVNAAEREFKKAIELKPSYATAHQWYAIRLNILRRKEEALAEFERALELDPLSPIINVNYGDYFYYNREYDKAIGQYKRTIDLFPEFGPAQMMLAAPLVAKSMFEEAFEALERWLKMSGEELGAKMFRAYVFATMRKSEEARKLLSEIEGGPDSNLFPCQIAEVHFLLGEDSEGFAWLEKAYQLQSAQLKFAAVDLGYDRVRNDERFASIMKRIGLGPKDTNA